MNPFQEYLATIQDENQRATLSTVLEWIKKEYPSFEPVVKWNQPMFTNNGTFIIGFSVAKNHFSIAPEKAGMIHFQQAIEKAGYEQTMMLFKIKWTQDVNYSLLRDIIQYNITDKASVTTFWR